MHDYCHMAVTGLPVYGGTLSIFGSYFMDPGFFMYTQTCIFNSTNLLHPAAPLSNCDANVSNLIVIITALCKEFGTFAFNTVV